MTFTIATANEFLFPIFLFFFYFCAANLILKKTTTPKPQTSQPKDFTVADAFSSELEPPTELEPESELPEIPEPETTPIQPSTSELSDRAAAIIDTLNKRTARKLCAPLSIRQKTNGTEKSLTFLKAEIRSKFKENPLQVIEAIRDRLPDLLSDYSLAS